MNEHSILQQNTVKQREYLPDLLKAWGIILVVWGHAVQYCHGDTYDFLKDPVYCLIYGFHMPLFMLISGYLFAGTMKRHDVGHIIVAKSQSLLVPCLFWGIAMAVADLIQSLFARQEIVLSGVFLSVVHKTLSNFWFLKAVFVCCLIVILVERCMGGSRVGYFVICTMGIFAPDIYNLATIFGVLPFFVIGYRFADKVKQQTITIWQSTAAMLMYLLMLYVKARVLAEQPLLSRLTMGFFQFIIGLSGCLSTIGFAVFIVHRLPPKIRNAVSKLGSKTMVIYIASTIAFVMIEIILKVFEIHLGGSVFSSVLYDVLVLLPVAIVIIILCCFIEKLTNRCKILPLLLFGKR